MFGVSEHLPWCFSGEDLVVTHVGSSVEASTWTNKGMASGLDGNIAAMWPFSKGFQGLVFFKKMQGMESHSNELAVLGTSSGSSLCLRVECCNFKMEQLMLRRAS